MTDKELKLNTQNYWRFLKTCLNVLQVNNVVNDTQYKSITKKIDQVCGRGKWK